ncbi:MAG TPA: SAF domain-containing protein [Jatrophihabitantaceae bacterium]
MSKPRWLDLRLILGIALVLAAVVVGAEVVQGARHTDRMLAVTHDLAAGTILQIGDLKTVDARLPGAVTDAHVYVTDPAKAVGKVLARPLAAGELLAATVLGTAAGRTTVSVPLAGDAAPKLSRGQRIVVWLSTKACPSLVLLSDVTVQQVHGTDPGTFASGGTGQDVVLSVPPDVADRVVSALAIDDVTLRAGVLTGAPRSSGTALPDVDSCVAAKP